MDRSHRALANVAASFKADNVALFKGVDSIRRLHPSLEDSKTIVRCLSWVSHTQSFFYDSNRQISPHLNMLFASLATASLLQWTLTSALVVDRRDPTTDSHDRGTWHLDCSRAPGACNNACYSVICLQQNTRKMYQDSNDNNDKNRKNSGCNAAKSVCNAMPFSQKFNDPQGLTKPSCDEWPMAEVKQNKDSPPNVLRCIDQSENSCKSICPKRSGPSLNSA